MSSSSPSTSPICTVSAPHITHHSITYRIPDWSSFYTILLNNPTPENKNVYMIETCVMTWNGTGIGTGTGTGTGTSISQHHTRRSTTTSSSTSTSHDDKVEKGTLHQLNMRVTAYPAFLQGNIWMGTTVRMSLGLPSRPPAPRPHPSSGLGSGPRAPAPPSSQPHISFQGQLLITYTHNNLIQTHTHDIKTGYSPMATCIFANTMEQELKLILNELDDEQKEAITISDSILAYRIISMEITGQVSIIHKSQVETRIIERPTIIQHPTLLAMLYQQLYTDQELHMQTTPQIKPHILHVHRAVLYNASQVFRTICEAQEADRAEEGNPDEPIDLMDDDKQQSSKHAIVIQDEKLDVITMMHLMDYIYTSNLACQPAAILESFTDKTESMAPKFTVQQIAALAFDSLPPITHHSQLSSLLYAAAKYDIDPLIQHICYDMVRVQMESKCPLLPELGSMLQPYRKSPHVDTALRFWSVKP